MRMTTSSKKRLRTFPADVFLTALESCGNIAEAARSAGVHRATVYQRRKADSDFALAWDNALEVACDHLELEARRRALHGVSEPKFYQGAVCGHVQRYSDGLMTFLLEAHRPDKFRAKSTLAVEHSGSIHVVYERIDNPRDGEPEPDEALSPPAETA